MHSRNRRPVGPRPEFDTQWRDDGSLLLRRRGELAPYHRTMIDALEHWAERAPERTFLARRDVTGEWVRLSYAQCLASVRGVAAALVGHRFDAERPIVILSGNGIEHALLGLAAMYAGVPYAPVSPPYALLAGDLGRLRYVLELLTPGLVAAFGSPRFATALVLARKFGAETVSDVSELVAGGATRWCELFEMADAALASARAGTGPDSIAKFMLTSGSTGQPKAVITTQRMLCSNQAMILEGLPLLADEPPVMLDWLPWHHTFGGSHNFGLALTNGGTLHIDDGIPTPAGIAETVRNLREISPTIYFNVPRGFEMLLPHLETDRALATRFFSRLRTLFYGGAALSQPTWEALDRISEAVTGVPMPVIAGYGSTETAPGLTYTTPELSRAGTLGLPATGTLVKLVPVAGKLEMRASGPNVTPGYWRQPALTAAAFDEEGYLRLGDAVKLTRSDDPSRGISFDGRLKEDFKLSTGTWVSVGPLRAALITALAPFAQDVVIAGHDRESLGALLVLDLTACRTFMSLDPDATLAEAATHLELRAALAQRLSLFAVAHPQSSMRIARALVLVDPPSLAEGEITDKGSLNQQALLSRRSDLVELLYARNPPPSAIRAEARPGAAPSGGT